MSKPLSYNFCCPNDSCEVKWQDVVIECLEEDKPKCSICETTLKRMGRNLYGGNLAFNSMSIEQKQHVLKKRSAVHTEKIRDEIHQKNHKDYIQ